MVDSEENQDINDQSPESASQPKRRRLSDLTRANRAKDETADKINYFKTMPAQVRSTAKDLEAPLKILAEEHCSFGDIASTINRGRVSVIKVNYKQDKPL